MVKGLLKDEERDKFEEELATFSLMEDYLSKTGKTQLEFTSIRRMQELELGNGALKIPNILAMQSVDGKTELLNITKQEYDREEIEELSKRTYLTVELGLQTIHDKTSKLINRCHTLSCFNECVKSLRDRNINVVVHIINGLPYETKEMMLDTIKYLNTLDIQGIKIHMLHIVSDTALARLYSEKHFNVLTRDEYVDIVCDQLELLRSDIVINRITGDPDPNELIEPTWLIKKFCVLNEIDKEMARRDTYQGIKIDSQK